MENEKKNVEETVNIGCNGCFRCLSLSLDSLWYNPCRETPVLPYPKKSSEPRLISSSSQSLSITFSSRFSPSETTKFPSESSSPPPNRIPSPPPLPVWAVRRQHRHRTVLLRDRKPDLPVAPYEWATKQRATVHKLDYLVSRQILLISGEVQCKRCKRRFEIQYDLVEKFKELGVFINLNESSMLDRAPSNWMSPNFPNCRYCRAEKSLTPWISEKKRSINWLFLFLGEMIGCCKLAQLKYFCKQNDEPRTGAKDRVVYSTYIEMCKQLDPTGESFLSLINSVQELP